MKQFNNVIQYILHDESGRSFSVVFNTLFLICTHDFFKKMEYTVYSLITEK